MLTPMTYEAMTMSEDFIVLTQPSQTRCNDFHCVHNNNNAYFQNICHIFEQEKRNHRGIYTNAF